MDSMADLSDSEWDNYFDDADSQVFAFLSYCDKLRDKKQWKVWSEQDKLTGTRARNSALQNYVSSYQKYGRHTGRSVDRLLLLTNLMLSQALKYYSM